VNGGDVTAVSDGLGGSGGKSRVCGEEKLHKVSAGKKSNSLQIPPITIPAKNIFV